MLDRVPAQERIEDALSWRAAPRLKKDRRVRMPEEELRVPILVLFQENSECRLEDIADRVSQRPVYARQMLVGHADYDQNNDE
jgi:hypothetical protein